MRFRPTLREALLNPRRPAPLHALRAFHAAARSLSFQAAAAQLFVTPAAVSHQVKRLEEFLGVKLFHRRNRAVELTPEGNDLAASLNEVFSELDHALDRLTSPPATMLHVSTMESFAAKWLAPRLHRFHRQFPDIRLRVDTGDGLADLVRGSVSVAIRYGAGGYAGVHSQRLMDATVFPVCAPALQKGEPPLRHPRDLRHHTLLHDESAKARPGVPDWAAWLAAVGNTSVDPTRGPLFSSIYLAQEAAIAGHGIALGVAPLVEEDLRRGRLVRPFQESLPNGYSFWIVRRDGVDRPSAVDLFCQWLHSESLHHQ
jgi:LysR family glycine cleavage system transcriptional activator